MAEPTVLEWDKDKAIELFNAYKTHWQENLKYGITGKGDAGTGKPNSKTVWQTILRHGDADRSRKDLANFGASDIIQDLEELLDDEIVFVDSIQDMEDIIEEFQEVEDTPVGTDCMNPRNIPFHTVVKYKPAKGDNEAIVERDVVYGHFLTPAYYEYRKDKAAAKEEDYNVSKPETNWTNKDPNRAKPPLWQALFGPKNSLKLLLKDILDLLKGIELPPGPIDVDFRFNKRTVQGLAQLPSIEEYVYSIIENPNIYKRGSSRAPMPSRLNQLASDTVIRINSKRDIEEMAKIATITVSTEEGRRNVRLDEIPGWEKLTEVKVSWPKSNRFLRALIVEVMGDEVDTFQKPGTSPDEVKPGLMLKSVMFTAEAIGRDIEELIIEHFGDDDKTEILLDNIKSLLESLKEYHQSSTAMGNIPHIRDIGKNKERARIVGQDIAIKIHEWLKTTNISQDIQRNFFVDLKGLMLELDKYWRLV